MQGGEKKKPFKHDKKFRLFSSTKYQQMFRAAAFKTGKSASSFFILLFLFFLFFFFLTELDKQKGN
jgi:uncharacterized membrane protein